jgi:serine protease Do
MNRFGKSVQCFTGDIRMLALCVGILVSVTAPSFSSQQQQQQCKDIARQLSQAFAATAKSAMPAVVSITVEKTVDVAPTIGSQEEGQYNNPYSPFGDDFLRKFFGGRLPQMRSPRRYLQRGQGSGFIISKDGYILTNNHVVGDVDKMTVSLKDGRTFTNAKVIGTDPDSEVALIKIEGDNFPVLPLGDSDKMQIGDWVMAIGNPFGLTETVTVGVVSAVGRSNVHIAAYEDFIQTDAAINPGNSGGPLINLDGQAIGINTAIVSESGGYMGIGFAIPANMARTIEQQLRKTGRVIRGYMGLYGQAVTPQMAQILKLERPEGILVAQVERGSPAEQAGLKPGDVILAMNGKAISSYDDFRNQIAIMAPGTKVMLPVIRDGKVSDVTVTLGERPTEAARAKQQQAVPESQEQTLGVQVQNLTRDMAQQFGYQPGDGVIVSRVVPGSPADNAGVEPGDLIRSVNRQPVTSTDEFAKAVSEARKVGRALLLIQRGEFSQFIVVQLGQ